MKHRNWFWGIFFLAAAIFVVAGQTGAFAGIGFWSVAATILFAAVFLSSLAGPNFFGLLIPLALCYLIYQRPLHLLEFSFWQLILAAFLAAIGLSMIFRNRCHFGWGNPHGADFCQKSVENLDGDDLFVNSSFCESCKYLHSESLKSAHLTSSFGKLSVYFDQVRLSPEGAEVRIDASFGEMILYVPKSWRVIDQVHVVCGVVNTPTGQMPPDPGAPTLLLTGSVSFGSLAIRFS